MQYLQTIVQFWFFFSSHSWSDGLEELNQELNQEFS